MYIQDFQLEVNVLVFDCYKISAPLRLYCFLVCTIVSVSSSFLILFGVHNHWHDRYYRLFSQNIDFQVMQVTLLSSWQQKIKSLLKQRGPLQPELIQVSIALSNLEHHQHHLDGMLVHCKVIASISLGFPNNLPVPIYTPGWTEALRE